MIRTNFDLQPKNFFVILLLFTFLFSCKRKEDDPYKKVVFTDGLPATLHPLEKDLPFKNFSYSSLDTGTDTLQVFFGRLTQGDIMGYWVGIEANGKLAQFTTVSLEEVDSLNYFTKDIDIEFNEERNRVSLRIIEKDSLTIKYSWLDDNQLSENLALKQIEKPLRKEIQFPSVNLQPMTGEDFSINQFENKFVVINWWATWCKPCIEEIPGLNGIAEKYSNNENVRFIAITDDPKSRVLNFLKANDFNYEMTFATEEVRTLFGNTYPVNLIIDPMGKITYLSKGAHGNTPNEIESSLKQQMEAFYTNETVRTELNL